MDEVLAKAEEIAEAQKKAAGGIKYPEVEEKAEIEFSDFEKIQIRVERFLHVRRLRSLKSSYVLRLESVMK